MWLKSKLGPDWQVVLFWLGAGLIALTWAFFSYALPKYQYAHASFAEQCQINLKKLHDSDKFCNDNYEIKSHKAVAEAERRAALTPKQRCEEDHKTSSDPDSGETYNVFCHDDGTYDVKTDSELADEAQQAQSDYYSSLRDDAQGDQADSGSTTTGCYPLSNAGNCYNAGQYCRNADAGKTGVAGNGRGIKCEDNNGLRWTYY